MNIYPLSAEAQSLWTAAACIRGTLKKPMSRDTAWRRIRTARNSEYEKIRKMAIAVEYEFAPQATGIVTPLDCALAAVRGFVNAGERPCDS